MAHSLFVTWGIAVDPKLRIAKAIRSYRGFSVLVSCVRGWESLTTDLGAGASASLITQRLPAGRTTRNATPGESRGRKAAALQRRVMAQCGPGRKFSGG
jgi:hypothetical protein